ncbi:hypothetical protein MIND_00132700 [Mycena indigotica]|uniref:Uncharacterized protein n=1 Tax=Mycena indigotica TaxID=2126181 RepID=A0A8H6TC90_9AGAR|nr:uncharacterized protein MIND_00132700 [Mycena indigotica]KAF7316145.1 hypothetical protein MIND_00132700 [Mycena indigotica]
MSTFPPTTTSATQKKERKYAELASALQRMSKTMAQTADLCQEVQLDLHAMRDFAGIDAAKYASFILK